MQLSGLHSTLEGAAAGYASPSLAQQCESHMPRWCIATGTISERRHEETAHESLWERWRGVEGRWLWDMCEARLFLTWRHADQQLRIWRITRRAVLVFSQRSTSMDFKAALQTQPPRSPATLFFFVIPFVTHVFDHTHICERALLHTEFAMASVRDFAHRFPVRCGKKSYQHGCRTAQVLSGYHGLKSQGFRRCCGVRNF